jgi:outer membrane protein OmpA-like peptidoglycan-associated protein
MAKLDEVAEALTKSNPESRIVVEGHTDSQGKSAFNEELSFRRAQSVRDYLANHGIANDRISAKGMGSSRPIATNGNPEGRANNRRVEIIVQPAGQ